MHRALKLIALLTLAWCAMVVVHECGHLVGGVLGGGTLVEVELRPWRLPHSLFVPDPKPLVTLWSGPVMGVALPMVMALVVPRAWRVNRPAWFIADFCLLANGTYLALAWLSGDRFLDTPRLLAEGASPVAIVAYCVLTIGFGYRRFRADVVAALR